MISEVQSTILSLIDSYSTIHTFAILNCLTLYKELLSNRLMTCSSCQGSHCSLLSSLAFAFSSLAFSAATLSFLSWRCSSSRRCFSCSASSHFFSVMAIESSLRELSDTRTPSGLIHFVFSPFSLMCQKGVSASSPTNTNFSR